MMKRLYCQNQPCLWCERKSHSSPYPFKLECRPCFESRGYTVEVQCTSSASLAELHTFMNTKFPGACKLEEEQMLRVKYSLSSQNGLQLSHVFASLEAAEVEDYSVSQSTLEQVFLTLANAATNHDNELHFLHS